MKKVQYSYYCHETGRLYFTFEGSYTVWYKSLDFNTLCGVWWQKDIRWTENFGRVAQGIRTEYKMFRLKPGPQVPIEYLPQICFRGGKMDLEKSFHLMKYQINQRIDGKINRPIAVRRTA